MPALPTKCAVETTQQAHEQVREVNRAHGCLLAAARQTDRQENVLS